ncbi:MAG: ketopantoate reductase family protein [Intestinibacter bartlettii]
MQIKNVAMIGAGAIGGVYAYSLHKLLGDNFAFIANGKRKERLEQEGLYLNGEHFNPKVVSSDGDTTFDLIIVSVKNYQLQSAIEDMRSLVGKNTIILTLLNGISARDVLQEEFKDNQVLYGLAIKIEAVKVGNKITQNSKAIIQFGDKYNKTMSEEVLAVKNLLNDAKINNQVFEDMIKTVWTKWMLNIGLNQVSAISGATYRVINKTPELLTLVNKAMTEVMEVSKACNINLGDENWASVQDVIDALDGDGKTSLLQDVENKRKTEVEYFSGTLIKIAKEHNVEVPVNEVLYNFIKAKERNYID